MARNAIDPYYGEFMTSPIPLEMSFNYCNYKCAYCFANLASPNRRVDISAAMRLLANYADRKCTEAMLLREGYPVLMSNRSDPFSANNYKQSIPVMRVMAEMGIQIAFQTKGGKHVDEALEFLPPSCWYISMSFWDDAKRKRIEPGAPAIQERLDLISKLVQHGHKVYLGLNPCESTWLGDDAPRLISECVKRGISGAWLELLHLNRKQIANMTVNERGAMTDGLLSRVQHDAEVGELDYLCECRKEVIRQGIPVFSARQGMPSHYWDGYLKVYKKLFPTHQEFVNLAHEYLDNGDYFGFDDYWSLIKDYLPHGIHRIEDYIRVPARALFMSMKIPHELSYQNVAEIGWLDARVWYSLAQMECFSYACDGDDLLVDDKDRPLMVFSKNKTLRNLYQQISEL